MIRETLRRWNEWQYCEWKDESLTEELYRIVGDKPAIEARYSSELKFGTGGLRGKMGVGPNRMNLYTVDRATRGYSGYLLAQSKTPSVVLYEEGNYSSSMRR